MPDYEAPCTELPVDQFFDVFGHADSRGEDAFWCDLEQQFGRRARRLRETAALAESEVEAARRVTRVQAFYDLKNESLDLALAALARFRGPFLRRVMRVIEVLGIVPVRIVDLGCDIGILSCFLAHRFPQSQVVAVDRSGSAIALARELARRLRIENISFEATDIHAFARNAGGCCFDLAVSVDVFEHVVEWPRDWGLVSYGNTPSPGPPEETLELIDGLVRALAPGGLFASIECFMSPVQHWRWIRCLNDRGLTIAWDRTAVGITDANPSAREGAWLVCATKQANLRVARWDDYLASALVPQLELTPNGRVFEGLLAEVLFDAICQKILLRGFEVYYPCDGGASVPRAIACERVEVWQAGPLLLFRRASSAGDRRLELRSAIGAGDAIEELLRFAALLAGEYGADVRWQDD
jgi:SAM-dependent methyltransferase